MKFSQCKYLIECDLHAINNGGILKNLLFNESFSFTFWFRIGNWLKNSISSCVLSILYFTDGKCVKRGGRYLWELRLVVASD